MHTHHHLLPYGVIVAILCVIYSYAHAQAPADTVSATGNTDAGISVQQATPYVTHDTIYVLYTRKCQIPGYVRDRKPSNRHEITIGYGFLPANEFRLAGCNHGLSYHTTSLNMCGAVQVGYCYRFTKVIGVGLHYIFNPTICKIYKYPTDNETILAGKANLTAHTIMPSLKVNWLNRDIVVMYSQVGLGITFRQQNIHNYLPDLYEITPYGRRVYFAYQFTLVGIELGNKRYAAYLHIGIGMEGFLAAGFRLGL